MGRRLGLLLTGGSVVALHGDLGAGKTTFAQGLARGLGVESAVTSPTFILINEYPARDGLILVHVDGYRLAEVVEAALPEAMDIGLTDYLQDPECVIVIEWAERVASLLPDEHLAVDLMQPGDDPAERRMTFVARGEMASQLLPALMRSSPVLFHEGGTDV